MTMGLRPILRVVGRPAAIRLGAMTTIFLSSCAPGANLPGTSDAKIGQLGPGDVVRITTLGEHKLSGEFTVRDDGSIAMPLGGSTPAMGLSVDVLASDIQEELRAKLLRNLKVTAEVATYRPVYVIDEVRQPGMYSYELGMTAGTVVLLAGGFTNRGVQDYASVLRVAGGKVAETRAEQQTVLQPGDVITIFTRRF